MRPRTLSLLTHALCMLVGFLAGMALLWLRPTPGAGDRTPEVGLSGEAESAFRVVLPSSQPASSEVVPLAPERRIPAEPLPPVPWVEPPTRSPGDPGATANQGPPGPRDLLQAEGDEQLVLARALLRSESRRVQALALEVLARHRPLEAWPLLTDYIRECAAEPSLGLPVMRSLHCLSELPDGIAVADLRELYEALDPGWRPALARAAAMQGDEGLLLGHIERTVRGLLDPDGALRLQAVEELAVIHHPAVCDPLVALLSDSNSTVRLRVLETLGAHGDASFREVVRPLLQDPVARVRHQAERTLARLP